MPWQFRSVARRWQWKPFGTQQWMDVVDGVNMLGAVDQFTAQGAAAGTLTISSLRYANTHHVNVHRCVATNSCGNATSNEVTLTNCAADFNCSGAVTAQDIFDFLAAYFSHNASADFNGSGQITVQDIFDFLAAFFAGCA